MHLFDASTNVKGHTRKDAVEFQVCPVAFNGVCVSISTKPGGVAINSS